MEITHNYCRVIFVCTGNYYRSRLAEILFNHYALKSKLKWEAVSRGLFDRASVMGLSPDVIRYLECRGFDSSEHIAREPERLRVEDLETSQLVIILNKNEHKPIMKMKFGYVPIILEKAGRLRYWNVYDVPSRRPMKVRIFRPHGGGEQPPESSGEHIDFAVSLLVHELSTNGLEASYPTGDMDFSVPYSPKSR
jgi:protein-tyrosine phosphatase